MKAYGLELKNLLELRRLKYLLPEKDFRECYQLGFDLIRKTPDAKDRKVQLENLYRELFTRILLAGKERVGLKVDEKHDQKYYQLCAVIWGLVGFDYFGESVKNRERKISLEFDEFEDDDLEKVHQEILSYYQALAKEKEEKDTKPQSFKYLRRAR